MSETKTTKTVTPIASKIGRTEADRFAAIDAFCSDPGPKSAAEWAAFEKEMLDDEGEEIV